MEKIHVTVRTRPLSPEDDKTSPWRISGNSISNPNHSSKFEFERIFGESCKTQEVYEARTKNIVAAAVRGFNGTVFAYGQTNNGKTHTIRGSTAEPGVIPSAVHDLFGLIQEILTDAALLKRQKKEIEELKHKISLLEVSNAELKGELQEIRIAFEHLAQRGLDAQVERTAGLCCTCSRHSLCQTTMCRCRAGGGSCGVSCGCLSYRCLNR